MTAAGNPVRGAHPAARTYRQGYKRLVTLLLMLAYAFNAGDRGLVSVIAQPMKSELRLSDTQLGLLAGTAFASLYALSAVPIARLAERLNRVAIISLSLAAWSALTALCATATSFAGLLLMRVGVGIAEAGCAAPAHSLISDYYDRQRRTTALSVYSCGLSLGYLMVSVVGGYVLLHGGWRAACVAAGLPGIALAALIRRVVDEPPRGHADAQAARAGPPASVPAADSAPVPPVVPSHESAAASAGPNTLRLELLELAAVARELFLSWPTAHVILGLTIASFASYGSYVFIPAYFNRAFGLDFATIGVVVGLAGSVPVALGTLTGGWLCDLAAARGARWYALLPAAGLMVCAPLYLLAFSQAGWGEAAVLLGLAGFFQYTSLGPTFGVIQNVVTARRRATATALLYLCLTLLALAGGAPFTGWLIDRLAEAHFAGRAVDLPGGALRALVAGGGSAFRAACPGGGGQPGCARALALASREGIMLTLCLYVWAAAHFALGAIGLERQMRGAQLSSR